MTTLSNLNEGEHVVQFYQKDSFLLDAVSDFMGAGLVSGAACILIATSAHREALEERLRAKQIDLSSAQDTYFTLDATSTLSQVLVDGEPDPERFAKLIGGTIEQATQAQKRIYIIEEMAPLLWQQGYQGAAVHLETLWNNLCKNQHTLSLLCAYPMSLFVGPGHEKLFTQVCDLHSRAIPDVSYSRLLPQ